MKKLLFGLAFLFSVYIFSQTYYDQQWKKIEENYKKGTFKSNMPIIQEIQNQAMKDNNVLQIIKSLKAEFSINNLTEDDSQNNIASKTFAKLKTIEDKLKGEDKLLYKVLLNEYFQSYYDMNSWEISQRTNINNQDVAQIETWSKMDFKNYLQKNFNDFENEKATLKKINLSQFKGIFEQSEDLDYFPTLFDWNATKHINFLKNTDYFTPNERKENNHTINSIFNEVIADSKENINLYFQHKKIDYNCQITNCKNKLEQLQSLVNDESVKGDYKIFIISEIMSIYEQKKQYNQALDWAKQSKTMYPNSKFHNNISNIENSITQPTLIIYYEIQTQSKKPIHIVAEGKNTSEFSLNIYEIKEDVSGFMKFVNDNQKNSFSQTKKTLVRKQNFQLNKPIDYSVSKSSLELEPLPSGAYLAEYIVEGKVKGYFHFIVSESKIVYQNKKNRKQNENLLKLVNNETGQYQGNQNLEIFEYVNGKPIKNSTLKTSSEGIFKFQESTDKRYYRTYLIKSSGNSYNLMQSYGNDYYYPTSSDEQNRGMSQIFLDRKIYRPGQTIYFKAVSTYLNASDKKERVAEKLPLTIKLRDANGEEISSQKLTTNEFGSVHGNFVLPKGLLNGNFSVFVEGNQSNVNYNENTYFNVEEYKRPKFEVNFEPIKDEYKYGETIEVKGKATTFSGIPLNDVDVNYEIKKQNIRWRYFSWYPRDYNDNENSILGTAKTNEKGEFTIKLDLKKDETLEGIQIDNYQIEASVTDINGETQSATTNVKVASVSHFISAESINQAFADENIKLKVETKNYNNQNLKKTYHTKLSKLEEPQRIIRNNFKNKVQDKPIFSKEDFIKKFPHDLYDKNDVQKNWKVSQEIINRTISQKEIDDSQELELGKLSAGTYKLELSNIEGNDTIRSEQYFSIWDKKNLKNQYPFLKVVSTKDEIKRGEKKKIYVYSAIPDALVTIFVQNGNGETQTQTIPIKNGVLEYEVLAPMDESIDRINLQFQMVGYNDVQTEEQIVSIKNSKTPLKVETVTFRDKLQPNQKEKWTIKVVGDDKEKVTAELLANMYDKSLDQFAPNTFSWRKIWSNPQTFVSYMFSQNLSQEYYSGQRNYLKQKTINEPYFDWFGGGIYEKNSYLGGLRGETRGIAVDAMVAPAVADSIKDSKIEEVVVLGYNKTSVRSKVAQAETIESETNEVLDKEDISNIQTRQNLNETAFFYPDLVTDKDGNINFEFTSPESLTAWKVMFLAHTKDARGALLEKEVVTQKEFSVSPNYPRFLREGDEFQLQTKLSNLTANSLNGTAQLQILDAFTNENITEKFGITQLNAAKGYNIDNSFLIAGNGNEMVSWNLRVPDNISSIILKVVAKAGNFSDGEQKAIAVLPNRMLITDALPIFVKEGQNKTFVLDALKNSNSTTLSNVSNTLELTTNPIWEILFALPSLKDDVQNSADVQFNKWFADVIASEIFKANPKMKTVFDEYQSKGLLASNLEKNQELKQLLLEETPWVLESKNEQEQMQKIARLFDANMMRNSINQDWADVVKLQNPDGGFSWYSGYPSSYYTSSYILKNLGRINDWLKNNLKDYQSNNQKELVSKLVSYVDSEVNKYWDTKHENYWNNFVLDYLDTRQYWEKEYPLKGKGLTLKTNVISKAKKADIKDFTFFGLHRSALLFNNYGLKDVSKKLLMYLKETSTQSETQGVYWKQNLNDWGWYSSKTVNHAGALEAFQKLSPNDITFIEEAKIWLITQKEVNSWGTSRNTAEVIFTILNSGKSWTTTESDKAEISWGGKLLQPQTQAAGYVKQTIISDEINKNLATVNINKTSPGIVQGGVFWQYYEDLDKINSSENYISITKELYRKMKTVNGEELQKITENTPLKIGDKVTVRMILNSDRNMEFVHLKDMRASGFEPLDVISSYQWKNNLGYYQSIKDASTNFYIEYMPKGKYVFEYDYICNAAGKFSNGITTLQNYYAPQMNAHTQGTKVEIKE